MSKAYICVHYHPFIVKKFRIPKLIGLSIMTMAILVILSIIEVAIYSYLVNPGQDITVYDSHAMESAPWISALFGFLVFFMVVRFWARRKFDDLLRLTMLFAVTYITIDLIIIIASGVNWGDFYLIFLLANGAKLAGGLTAYRLYKPKVEGSVL